MCILNQYNVYHFCMHTETVTVPSVNPFCRKNVMGHGYVMNEWCPRCRWWGVLPYEYTEYAAAVHCGGFSGKVLRTITFSREEFEISRTKNQMWQGRLEMVVNTIPQFRQDQVSNVWLREQPIMEAGFNYFQRSYFMEESLPEYHEKNRCPPLFYNIDNVPADRDQCEVCKGRLTETREGEEDNREPCLSGYGQAVYLPCDHYFGLNCISEWMGNPDTPTCPTCRQRYRIIHEFPRETYVEWPPGFEDQRRFDLAPEHEITYAYRHIMFVFFLKIGLVYVLFTPFPQLSWTLIFGPCIEAIVFYYWFIVLVQMRPYFAWREKIMQNRSALFTAFASTAEILLGLHYSKYERQYSWLPAWFYPLGSWVVFVCYLAYFRPGLRLPAEIRGRSGIQVLM